MAKLAWDVAGEHVFESGVDHGVLYRMDAQGGYTIPVVWNGLTSVKETNEGGDINSLYADNIKYLDLVGTENFKFTIEAYTYPDEFMECDGTKCITTGSGTLTDIGVRLNNQTRQKFGFCYRTKVGNDASGQDAGYKLHLVYACLASPTDKEYSSVNDNPDAVTFSWECSTTPIALTGDYASLKPVSHIVIDSTVADATKLAALEATLYGTDGTPGTTGQLPLPNAVITALS